MDALSQILKLARVQGTLDLRCLLAGHFSLDHEPAPNGEAPFHLVLSGRALLELRSGETLTLEAGDFVLLPRGSAHLIRDAGSVLEAGPLKMERDRPLPLRRNSSGEPELDLLCGRYTFAPGSAALILGALPDALHVSLAETNDMDRLRVVATLLRNEVTQLQPGALSIVTALSQALFVLALRAYSRRDGVPTSMLVLLGDPRLSKAVQVMLCHPEKAWTLSTLAQQATMSRATFARHFKAKGNISVWELLTQLRMHMACDLLRIGELSTPIVAERVGYKSDSAFGKAFTRYIGFTPANFRRMKRRE